MSISLCVCVLQVCKTAKLKRNQWLTPAAPPSYLTQIKVKPWKRLVAYVSTHTQTKQHILTSTHDPLLQESTDRVTLQRHSSSPCQPFSSWPSPLSSSSCFTSWRPSPVVRVRDAHVLTESHAHVRVRRFFLDGLLLCVSVCSVLPRSGGEGCGGSDQQTGRQERRPRWDMLSHDTLKKKSLNRVSSTDFY